MARYVALGQAAGFLDNSAANDLGRAGSLSALLDGPVAPPMKVKPSDGTSVHRLKTESGRTVYLKRYPAPHWRRIARRLLLREGPASAAADEYSAAKVLQAAGVPVMKVLGWGERRIFGFWTAHSFILSEEVVGRELVDVLSDDAEARPLVIEAAGRLAAEMHARGVYFQFRPNDIIVAKPLDGAAEPILTIIDPDVKGRKIKAGEFRESAALSALAYSGYMMLRCRITIKSGGEVRRLLRSYIGTLRTHGIVVRPDILRCLRAAMNEKLAAHAADAKLSAMFPYMPHNVQQPLSTEVFIKKTT